MNKAREFVTAGSLASIGGASAADWVASSVISNVFGLDAKWVGLLIAMVISFVAVPIVDKRKERSRWSPLAILGSILNGCLIYATAVGINSVNNGIPGGSKGKEAAPKRATLIPIIDSRPWWPPVELEKALGEAERATKEANDQLEVVASQVDQALEGVERARQQLNEMRQEKGSQAERALLKDSLGLLDNVIRRLREVRGGKADPQPKPNGLQEKTEKIRQLSPVTATTPQGTKILFPAGDISWADRVVSFKPGNPAPRLSKDPNAALGKPDFRGPDDEADQRRYVSLGHGGELILEFTDNLLVDGPGADLAVFEVGSAVEPVDLAISVDGKTWVNVGRVKGATSTLDIGPFVKRGERFRFVRLTDAKAGLSNDSAWPGADIDAVGAINTIPVPPP
jgi:hypothetical protein